MIGFNHVCLGTAFLEPMVEFYCDHLNCSVEHSFITSAGFRYGVMLRCEDGASFLELFHEDKQPATGIFRHICFEVQDLDKMIKYFRNIGCSPSSIIVGKTDGKRQFWISDPARNRIEFHEKNRYDTDT